MEPAQIGASGLESPPIHSLVSMNASLYPNRRRVSGLSEDGKADRVIDKKGMGKSEMSPKSIYRGGFPQNHVAVDGDDMAVHNVGILERQKGEVAKLADAETREVRVRYSLKLEHVPFPVRIRASPHKCESHINGKG